MFEIKIDALQPMDWSEACEMWRASDFTGVWNLGAPFQAFPDNSDWFVCCGWMRLCRNIGCADCQCQWKECLGSPPFTGEDLCDVHLVPWSGWPLVAAQKGLHTPLAPQLPTSCFGHALAGILQHQWCCHQSSHLWGKYCWLWASLEQGAPSDFVWNFQSQKENRVLKYTCRTYCSHLPVSMIVERVVSQQSFMYPTGCDQNLASVQVLWGGDGNR